MDALPEVIYLHGLGSSPQSDKAVLVTSHLQALGYKTRAPELSVPSLAALSVDEAVATAVGCIEEALKSNTGCVVVGSSFGGFVALRALGQVTHTSAHGIRGMVLMAPVLTPWHATCGMITTAMEETWERDGFFPVQESVSGQTIRVHVEFIRQLKQHSATTPLLTCPTLIIHGGGDEVVPVGQSAEFCSQQPMARLVVLDDNHRLLADPARLLAEIECFVTACITHPQGA